MLKKIVSIFIVFAFAIFLLGYFTPTTFAEYYPSPTITKQDMKWRQFPSVATNLYRVCDNDGNLVRFLELEDVSYSIADEDFYYKDAKYVMRIDINTELVNDEYMELIIRDENEITVYLNDIKVPVEKIGKFNIVHVIDSGLMIIN